MHLVCVLRGNGSIFIGGSGFFLKEWFLHEFGQYQVESTGAKMARREGLVLCRFPRLGRITSFLGNPGEALSGVTR